ncbi:MAG TPA: hypothetical protein VFZ09_26855 [Archangium sp.]|uniref:hypothetical protein n=1 Tax=Archangium sp. TaxID=1872627 RepID=UPI002E307B79|nr:hypothetical protein [Archangium sp.]HEX5749880.1 hypothetical protein [Archangium sp.]
MGRTYSFEPFKSQQPAQTYQGSGPRLGNDEHELALSQDKAEHAMLPKAPATYGQAHAETVKRYRSRAQARKRAPAAKTAGAAKPAARKATAQAKPAAAKKAPARKQTAAAAAPKATPSRKPLVEKSPARKSADTPVSLRNVGRKVLSRAAAAAKKTVARAVKTAARRVPTKKR